MRKESSSRDPLSGGATQDFRLQDNRGGGRFLRRGTAAAAACSCSAVLVADLFDVFTVPWLAPVLNLHLVSHVIIIIYNNNIRQMHIARRL